ALGIEDAGRRVGVDLIADQEESRRRSIRRIQLFAQSAECRIGLLPIDEPARVAAAGDGEADRIAVWRRRYADRCTVDLVVVGAMAEGRARRVEALREQLRLALFSAL